MLQTSHLLQKEQVDLYAIEKKLVKALPQVQEALNCLKVEELHLKSQSLSQAMSTQKASASLHADVIGATTAQNVITPNEQINRQEIDLGMFGDQLQSFDVETDSE